MNAKLYFEKAINLGRNTMAFGIPNTVGGFLAVKAAGMAIDIAGAVLINKYVLPKLMKDALKDEEEKEVVEKA